MAGGTRRAMEGAHESRACRSAKLERQYRPRGSRQGGSQSAKGQMGIGHKEPLTESENGAKVVNVAAQADGL